MPSNSMKISQLIHHLEGQRAFHGDLDVAMVSLADQKLIALDGKNLLVTGEVFDMKLAQPVLVIGLLTDEAGRIRNAPGQTFQATADDGEWTYDRNAAPEGVDIAVWKRFGGEDIGRREGEKWYVREGAAEWPPRPIEIVPAGILGWKRL